jgi:hypothetical protein
MNMRVSMLFSCVTRDRRFSTPVLTNPKTRRAYKEDVREFIAFTGLQDYMRLRSVGRSHIISWRKDMERRGLAPATIRRKPLDKNYIVWGNSQSVGLNGYWPAVALSKEGYVIAVHSDREYTDGSQQYYRVGKIDPNGDEHQFINWITDLIHWDGGFHTSIAINDNGVIVGVHESNTGGTGLYYRVGHLKNPAGGDYTIAWSSGSSGVNYDDGINPHIAINNHNQVVEVHQVTGEDLLHYRRGTVSEGKIIFAASQRYENDARRPAVALLDSGLVLEVHGPGSFKIGGGLYSRTEKLDPSNSTLIEWSPSVNELGKYGAKYPALAANGRFAYQMHEISGEVIPGNLIYSSGAEIDCPDL